jgi:nucleolar complex protein 2
MIWMVRFNLLTRYTEDQWFLPEEGEVHLLELSKLAEKDPEFYKYLQENDQELLKFDPHAAEPESDDGEGDTDQDMEIEDRMPILTQKHLRTWQKNLIQVCA